MRSRDGTGGHGMFVATHQQRWQTRGLILVVGENIGGSILVNHPNIGDLLHPNIGGKP